MTVQPPDVLWHYTCLDGLVAILASGNVLRPNQHPFLPRPLVWLTDQADPDREALGLTSTVLSCDRLAAVVYVTDLHDVAWWPDYRQQLRPRPRARDIRDLEHGRRPSSWWVSERPLPIAGYAS
jgi:hypothetical protein